MRLIDADALMESFGCKDATKYGNKTTEQRNNSYSTMMMYEIANLIDDAPTIDAEPVRHGTWILHADGSGTCMECGSRQKHVWDYDNWQRYCGCCGAKMDRGVSDER